MKLEVGSLTYRGHEIGEKRAFIFPTYPEGHFLAREESTLPPQRAGLLTVVVDIDEIEAIEAGDMRLEDFVELGGDSSTFQPCEGALVTAPMLTDQGQNHAVPIFDAIEFQAVPVNLFPRQHL